MGYSAECSRFLGAVSGGASDAGKAAELNAAQQEGDAEEKAEAMRLEELSKAPS